jgi:hypothetical protein
MKMMKQENILNQQSKCTEYIVIGMSHTERRMFQNIIFSFNACVLFFQTASKLLGQIVIKLSGADYLINGSVSYFSWPRGAVKNC